MRCDGCAMVTINGVPCHETGCPDQWRTTTRECDWCGVEFPPAERTLMFCSESCQESFNG